MKRRRFLTTASQAGLAALVVRYLVPGQALAQSPVQPIRTSGPGQVGAGGSWWASRQLYEGAVKVTGGKIYAVDFRARDLAGWPATERRAVVLRADQAGHLLAGVDSAGIRRQFGPIRIVTGDDLQRWGCEAAPPFLKPHFYVRTGQCPGYPGQPLALLSFESTDHYLAHKARLGALRQHVRYGAACAPAGLEDYGASQFVYYQGPSQAPEFSFMQEVMAGEELAVPGPAGPTPARAGHYLRRIEADLAGSDWLRLRQRFETQAVDPLFMEPENGLSWYDSASQTLSLTLGTQSPHEDAQAIASFFAKAGTPAIRQIVVNCCYPGGGFGGRDSSDFPLHLAIAAMAEPDVSHRLVHQRADQFQAGLKRHASRVELEIAIDRQGLFQALRSHITLDGGGQNNYSFAVQSVAARNATGAYRFARSVVDAVARPSAAIPAGSMRGFGAFQSCFALECLLDEAAQALAMDPIALRLKNCIQDQGLLQTGVRLAAPSHAQAVLRAARRSRLWRSRARLQAEKTQGDLLYGTGFAAAFKTFGKNENACLAGVELSADGRLKLYIPGVDMGNGAATTLALSLAMVLGRPADEVEIGVTQGFDALQLVSTPAQSEQEQTRLATDPFWTPSIVMSSAASTSAYHGRHAVLEAARVLRDHGLVPAAAHRLHLRAQDLLSQPEAFTLTAQGLRWRDGRLVPYADLAQEIHRQGLLSGAMVHAYYRESWAQAQFELQGTPHRAAIDGLAIRCGAAPYTAIARQSVRYSPLRSLAGDANRMSSYAVIVAVSVNRTTGEVQVVDAEGFVACGPVLHKEIVEGQMQGAFAMGIGQALMESLGTPDQHAGQGDWNLHRYRVPRAVDCALGMASFHSLPSPSGEPAGMSEVVFNPVPSAIVNALANATQHRFRRLPVLATDVRKALL